MAWFFSFFFLFRCNFDCHTIKYHEIGVNFLFFADVAVFFWLRSPSKLRSLLVWSSPVQCSGGEADFYKSSSDCFFKASKLFAREVTPSSLISRHRSTYKRRYTRTNNYELASIRWHLSFDPTWSIRQTPHNFHAFAAEQLHHELITRTLNRTTFCRFDGVYFFCFVHFSWVVRPLVIQTKKNL